MATKTLRWIEAAGGQVTVDIVFNDVGGAISQLVAHNTAVTGTMHVIFSDPNTHAVVLDRTVGVGLGTQTYDVSAAGYSMVAGTGPRTGRWSPPLLVTFTWNPS